MAIFPQNPEIERKRQMAQMLLGRGMGAQSGTPLGALSQVLMTAAGGYGMKKAGEEEERQRKSQQEALAAALSRPDVSYQSLAQELAGVSPELSSQFAVKAAERRIQEPQKKKPIKVGNTLVDPDTYEVLFQEEPKKTDYERRLELAGLEPGTQEAQEFTRRQMMRPGTQVTFGGPQGPGMRERVLMGDVMERSKFARERNQGYLSAGADSRRLAPKYERAVELLQTVPTGFGEEAILTAKKIGKTIGNLIGVDIKSEDIANAEELQSILGDQIMSRIADTKGAVSDAEMRLFTQYSASFGKTPEGNQRIMRFALAMVERDAEVADMVRQLRKQGATSLEIQDEVDNFLAQNDLTPILAEGMQGAAPVMPGAVPPLQPNPPGLGAGPGTQLTPGMDIGGGIRFLGYE